MHPPDMAIWREKMANQNPNEQQQRDEEQRRKQQQQQDGQNNQQGGQRSDQDRDNPQQR